jgi:hypothetical protein
MEVYLHSSVFIHGELLNEGQTWTTAHDSMTAGKVRDTSCTLISRKPLTKLVTRFPCRVV